MDQLNSNQVQPVFQQLHDPVASKISEKTLKEDLYKDDKEIDSICEHLQLSLIVKDYWEQLFDKCQQSTI